jgi:hypothetical protein
LQVRDIIGRIAFEHIDKLKKFVDFQQFLLEVTTVAYRMLRAANELNVKLRRKIPKYESRTLIWSFQQNAYPE